MVDNGFETEFACYLDSQAALRWWHRNVARTQYGLQGWQRHKVYPDFVFATAERDGQEMVVVMETKGAHLQNDDTTYKRALLERLRGMFRDERLTPAGSLALESPGGARLTCDLVFDEAWRGELATRYFG
jgi:type III restriction enzyme